MTVDAARLAAVVSPLRRALLAAAREREGLPDIPDAQIEVLRALPRGTVASPGEVADRLGLRRPTLSNLLAAMEAAGLVARRRNEQDARRVEVVATPEALGFLARFDSAAAAIVAEAAASLTPAEAGALEAAVPALEALRDALTTRRIPR